MLPVVWSYLSQPKQEVNIMVLLYGYLGAVILAALANAQALSTTSSAVPTGTPIPGTYNGPLRPQVHFSPPQGFMNDPNGLHRDADGLWHLYYQCKHLLIELQSV